MKRIGLILTYTINYKLFRELMKWMLSLPIIPVFMGVRLFTAISIIYRLICRTIATLQPPRQISQKYKELSLEIIRGPRDRGRQFDSCGNTTCVTCFGSHNTVHIYIYKIISLYHRYRYSKHLRYIGIARPMVHTDYSCR